MNYKIVTDRELALERENERLTDQVKRQSATIHVQAVAIQSLDEQMQVLKADAERYRWIVGNIVNDNLDAIENAFEVFGDAQSCTKEEFDAAINAAMKETKS